MKTKSNPDLQPKTIDGPGISGTRERPTHFVLVALLSICVAEIGVMVLLTTLPKLGVLGTALLDGLILTLIVVPLLLFFALRPMQKYHRIRIEAEQALRSSQERYSHLFENLSDAAFLADIETGLISETNRQAEVLLGRPKDEIIGMHQTELPPPEKIEEYRAIFKRQAAAGAQAKEISSEVITRQGARVPVTIGASQVTIDGRKYLLSLFRDERERLGAKEAMRESDEKYRLLADSLPQMVYEMNLQGTLTYVNKHAHQMVGFSEKDFHNGINVFQLLSPEEHERAQKNIGKLLQRSEAGSDEYTFVRKDGSRLSVEICSIPMQKNGQVTGLRGFILDITERKKAGEDIRKNEKLLSEAQRIAHVGNWEWKIQTDELYWSPEVYRIHGLQNGAKVTNDIFMEFVHPDDRDRLRALVAELLNHPEQRYDTELRIIRADGAPCVIQAQGEIQRDSQGAPMRMFGTVQDITERKQAEAALHASEVKYRLLAETSPEMIYVVSPEGRVEYVNAAAARQFGGLPEAIAGKHLREIFPPERAEGHLRAILEVVSARQGIQREVETEFPSGKRWIDVRLTPMMDGGGRVTGVLGLSNDITQRREAEKALQRSERLFRALIEHSYDAVAMISADGTILFDSPAVTRTLGYSPAERQGKREFDFAFPEDREKLARGFAQLVQAPGSIMNYQGRFLHKDGTPRWIEGVRTNLLNEPTVQAVVVNYRDITERKRAEAALQASEAKYRSILETTTEWIWEMDLSGKHTYSNQAVEKILGYSSSDILGGNCMHLIHDDDRRSIERRLPELIALKQGWRGWVIRWRHKDGSYRTLESNAHPIINAGGELTGYRGADRDISERQQAAAALQASEEKFAKAFRSSPVAVSVTRLSDGAIADINRSAETMLGYSYQEAMGRTTLELGIWADPNDRVRFTEQLRQQGMVRDQEICLIRKDGQKIITNLSAEVIELGGEQCLLSTFVDVTERRRAEEAIQKNLEEKEVLLKEIHHRVKNNLQIVSSLLNLQAAHLNGGTAMAAFKESQNRIRSMALIHEKLYQSGDMAQVNFGAYIRSLVSHLFHSYRTDANRVYLEMNIDDVRLGLDTSIPCGLIINELVSNALKHAFPADRKGNITVSFHKINGHHMLAVQDDGVGLAPDIHVEQTESLGLQLVNSLSQQLRGSIEVNRSKGTEFKVTF